MRYLILLSALFMALSVSAQHIEKSTVIGSPTDKEVAANLVADNLGNTYVGGYMNDKGLVVKQNSLHQTLWAKTITFPPIADNVVAISFLDLLGDTLFG